MRPDDRSGGWQPVDGLGGGRGDGDGFDGFDGFGPLDADLQALDGELDEAGVGARRALHGQTQPTRFFANRLRERLMAAYPAAAGAGAALGSAGPVAGVGAVAGVGPSTSDLAGAPEARGVAPSSSRRAAVRSELRSPGESWAPVALAPRVARRTPTVLPGRARWALLAAASLTGVIAAGALGVRFDWLLPPPDPSPTLPVAVVDPTVRPTPNGTIPPVVTGPTAAPTEGPAATPAPTTPAVTEKPRPAATPKPTPRPDPTATPTAKPDPTKPPILAMDLLAKACPGGVLLDWTKPSPEVDHYHTLRKVGGDVPATYPAAGTTEIDTATSFGAGTTDGFDVTITGGESATYRTFAFDADDRVMAVSGSRTVTTLGRIPLGTLNAAGGAPGTIDVSWAAADVNAACFTYGKLVASQDDPDPSYLKGSSYWAVVDSPSTTGVHLEGLPSGKTVWMRYEIVRVTSLGKFVVARTDVVQVTVP